MLDRLQQSELQEIRNRKTFTYALRTCDAHRFTHVVDLHAVSTARTSILTVTSISTIGSSPAAHWIGTIDGALFDMISAVAHTSFARMTYCCVCIGSKNESKENLSKLHIEGWWMV